ncbi:MAG: gyrase subunit A, DNA gyrase subunit A protein [candidate division WS6 bacterium GW2011_GWC1_33_20]|uniref:DNA topoisomerase (ATP-hydrolyzing) n=2 Tax=Candidatus Dojkabacteria TaxID=74243 RepID=A0A0G0CWT6_9BACT|nr:MAG: gyrase subunit A, DNA gyrase subunit A protein [candidate division WS6 bacterium GW2011_GWE2_33_157]KKP44383.1 MAG: gyrase subunit A, DNA gyrase subunit A protein [candidate division WS6 bacterium GW2011_GWC1_33_20]KKP46013.1 MAG: gyrase subunit A, DNA gyrase subunit A protein [candidate division WS6 bacterium GW2011_GWF1_33_233]KKP55475.1 MAG: gyrase subunit A protein [candidate division WS6 bacterium GW2011_GWB1_33_6]KKP55555.1 MAG: gyrase subunit A, DNA gyrase subunit A protein [cand
MSDKEEIIKKVEEVVEIENSDSLDSPTQQEDTDLDFDVSFKPGEVMSRSIVDEMKSNYIDYSMSVIVARALPEVKDGLKPSQRRILVAMNDLALTPSSHFRKCAKIAGDTSGNYHPHGESVVYPTLVKLAQLFSTRYPLVDGQGNFGSIDGDPAAAMRYTEARVGKITPELLKDLNKGTVTFIPNYDGTRLEPTVLPALFPNLLANGSQGIAVGMATQIPPHNLGELVDALQEMIKRKNQWTGVAIYNELRKAKEAKELIPQTLNSKPEDYLENYVNTKDLEYQKAIDAIKERISTSGEVIYPDFKSEISPEELITIVPGPDFPTGGTIYDRDEILNAYATGRGKILQRAQASIVEGSNGRYQIVITEIPYQVNKAYMIEKVADLVRDKKIVGIADIRDESNKDGIRVVVILKKDAQPKTVLNKLFKYTEMQKTFNANMIALVDQEPITLSLKRMLELFLSFRITVTVRRYEYDLAEARYHAHILEGLLKALDFLDEVIATIRGSKTQETAKTNLMDKFKFTDVQAQAILDMQLRRLAALERMKLQNDYKETKEKIIEYNAVLDSQDRILEIISSDLEVIKESYGDKRRTRVVKGKVDQISEEDLIVKEETLITITHSGYVKRVPPSTYQVQKRGGKGISGGETKEGDFIEHVLLCSTHDELLLFTNKGRVFNTRIFEIPEYGRTAKGIPLINLVQLDQNETITSILTRDHKGSVMGSEEIQEDQDTKKVVDKKSFKYFLMVTKNGVVKKTELNQFEKIRSNGLTAIKLDVNDELIWVKPTTGDDEVILVTADGKSIRFTEKDVRPMGRSTRGVTGMKFKSSSDYIVGIGVVRANENRLFTLSEKGFGKMSLLKEYTKQKRGGTGIFTFRVTEKTGKVAVARVLDHPNAEIVVISEKSKVIRSSINAIPVLGRQTSGVKVMKINDDDRVATMTLL